MSAAAFKRAVNFVLHHEGGYSNHEKDPGGETKFGISKRAYPDLDIAALTREQAIEIYRRDYWNKLPANLPPRLACLMFDTAVNAGHGRAVRLLQSAVGVTPDGVFGPRSQAALILTGEDTAIVRFCAERILFYSSLSTFDVFGKGWVRRVIDGVYQLAN